MSAVKKAALAVLAAWLWAGVCVAAPQGRFQKYISDNGLKQAQFEYTAPDGTVAKAPGAILRRAQYELRGVPMVFTMAAYQPERSESVVNEIIVWYSKKLGKPRQLILDVDDGRRLEIPVETFRLGRLQEDAGERAANVLFVGILGNPNYKLWKCRIDFSAKHAERLEFEQARLITLKTDSGWNIPLLSKDNVSLKRYKEMVKAVNACFDRFRTFNSWN